MTAETESGVKKLRGCCRGLGTGFGQVFQDLRASSLADSGGFRLVSKPEDLQDLENTLAAAADLCSAKTISFMQPCIDA